MSYQPITRSCSGRPVLAPAQGLEADRCGPFTAVRWTAGLPGPDWTGGLSISPGYAVGFSGPRLPQAWLFFGDLEPALACGRAARMSATVAGYGVYRAAEEIRHDHARGDERYLWLSPGPFDRQDDEARHLRAWLAALDPRSSPWPGSLRPDTTTILDRAVRLAPADLPGQCRDLPDGRRAADTITGLAAELRGRGCDRPWQDENGQWTGGGALSVQASGRFATVNIDALCYGGKIPAGPAAWLHRIAWHAGARMWADGYEGSISGGDGPCTYWTARCLKGDLAAVLLAALDLLLADSSALAQWYLSSACQGLCGEHYDPTARVCPSRWCGLAHPAAPCTCVCGGVNHASGGRGIPAANLDLDWSSLPPLAHPGPRAAQRKTAAERPAKTRGATPGPQETT